MTDDPIRVCYREGQPLLAADLAAEQEYLIALEERHNLHAHSAGIARGLRVDVSANGITPGVAVDDAGQLLTLEEPAPIAPPAGSGPCIDSWLYHSESPDLMNRPGRAPCASAQYDRIREETLLESVRAPSQSPVEPPAEGAVYLGRSGCNDTSKVRYVSLSAASVVDPARRAEMLVGPATGRDRNGFVVRATDAAGTMTERIAIERFGTNRLTGTIVLFDDDAGDRLILNGNGVAFGSAAAPPTAPLPGISSVRSGNLEELHLDLGKRQDDDTTVRFTAGIQSQNAFAALMQVTGSCAVVIPGNVVVKGTLHRAPMKADPTDPDFVNLMVAAWLSGLQKSLAASHVVSLAFDQLPDLIETDAAWSYKVILTNGSGGNLAVDQPFETLTIGNQKHYATQLAAEVVTTAHTYPVDHNPGDVVPGLLAIEFRVAGKIGGSPWWQAVTSDPIPVVQSPTIVLAVPPPAQGPWTANLIVTNGPDRDLTVTSVTIDNGTTQTTFGSTLIAAGLAHAFPSPQPALSAPVTITATVVYSWNDSQMPPRTVTRTALVDPNAISFALALPEALPATDDWKLEMKVSNAGEPVKLVNVRQRLTRGGHTITSDVTQNRNIKQSSTLKDIKGLAVPEGSEPTAKLEVELTFDAGGKQSVVKVEKEIPVQ